MESTNSRRKSKLVHIKNDFVDLEPIVVLTDIFNISSESDSDKKKKKEKKVKKLPTTPKKSKEEKISKTLPSTPKNNRKKSTVNYNESSEDEENIFLPKSTRKNSKKNTQYETPTKKIQLQEMQKKAMANSEIKNTPEKSKSNLNKSRREKMKTNNITDMLNNSDSSEDINELVDQVQNELVLCTPKRKAKILENVQIETPPSGVRRSGRKRILSARALDALQVSQFTTPEKKSHRKSTVHYTESESEEEPCGEIIDKPTMLVNEKDIAGQEIFGFRTPKKKDGILNRVSKGVDSPTFSRFLSKSPLYLKNSPKQKTKHVLKYTKTPQTVRKKIQKKLEYISRKDESESESSFSDFSHSESDFVPSESDKEESQNTADTSEDEIFQPKKKIIPVPSQPTPGRTLRPRKNKNDIAYTLKPDEYFISHGNKKNTTSDHTLEKLRLPQDKLQELLTTTTYTKEHEKSIHDLTQEYTVMFKKWMCVLFEGFSVLLFGLGSKRNILQRFQQEMLSEYSVIVINGYFPSLVVKDITDAFVDALSLKDAPTNVFDVVDAVEDELEGLECAHLFLIVNNIDGEMLRANKCQNVLSRFAQIKNVHLIASVDHINTPLIWDHSKLSRFNFTWWDATTFLPYSIETSFESSLLVQRSGALTLSSLRNIFKSLTTNSRGIYNIIVKDQIANKRNTHYQGISFKDLYWSCREAFLVSSDLALRAQLTEFLDHKLLKSRRSLDGVELLYIPIENVLLQHFLDEQCEQ